MDLPATLPGFLAYLAAPAFAAWVVSNVLESEAWFQAQTEQGRSRIVLALYVALGVLSYLLMTTVPTSLISQLQPLYLVVSASIAAYISGTVYHAKTTPTITVTATTTATSVDGSVTNKTSASADIPQDKAPDMPADERETPPTDAPFTGYGSVPIVAPTNVTASAIGEVSGKLNG